MASADVLKIAVWHNLPGGGAKRALYHHVRGLVQRGHHVEVWRPDLYTQDYLPLDRLAPEHVIPFDWRPSGERDMFGRLLDTYRKIPRIIRAMEAHCRHVAEEISRSQFDVVLANNCALLAISPIARYVNLPSVAYLQDPSRFLYEALPVLPWLGLPRSQPNVLYAAIERVRTPLRVKQAVALGRFELRNINAFDVVLVNSYFSRESIMRAFGCDARVCYLGVDAELFHPLRIPRERFVVGVGPLDRHKGVDRAIRGVGAIDIDRRPKLIWIGDCPLPKYAAELRSLADEKGVSFTTRHGVSDSEMLDLLNRAAALVYTSRLEPFGFVPLEANACETPVVAIAEGGVRETVVNGVNGLLTDDADPGALGAAILRLCDDADLANRLGCAGRKLVEERWPWDRAVDHLELNLRSAARA